MQISDVQKKIFIISAIIMIVLAVASLVLAQELPEGYRNIPGLFKSLLKNYNIFADNNDMVQTLPYGVQFLTVLPAIVVFILGGYMGIELFKQWLGCTEYGDTYIDTVEIIIGAIISIVSLIVLIVILGKILPLIVIVSIFLVIYSTKKRW